MVLFIAKTREVTHTYKLIYNKYPTDKWKVLKPIYETISIIISPFTSKIKTTEGFILYIRT